MNLFLIPLTALIVIGFDLSYGALSDYTAAKIEWNEHSFAGFTGTKSTVIVTDPDMNRYPNSIDYVWSSVHSDTDPAGFRIPLFETGFDTGVFEGEIVFVSSFSDRGFLQVKTGDTITAQYVDKSIPANYTSDSKEITLDRNGVKFSETAIIVGNRGPPMERLPASNFRLLSLEKVPIPDNSIVADKQVRLVSDLENQQNKTQPFAYLVQIKNDQEKVESLSWISGNLTSHQKMSSDVTWIPQKVGVYTATVFVWEGIDNPTALSPPLELEIYVRPN